MIDWQQDVSPLGSGWFLREADDALEVIAPPGVPLVPAGRGDAPGWRLGRWVLDEDRFVVPLQDEPDYVAELTTVKVLGLLPEEHHGAAREILEAQLALARQSGVATQQRLVSGGLDCGSLAERWLSDELHEAFGVHREYVIRSVDAPTPKSAAGLEQIGVRQALKTLLRVVRRRAGQRFLEPAAHAVRRRPTDNDAERSSDTREFAALA